MRIVLSFILFALPTAIGCGDDGGTPPTDTGTDGLVPTVCPGPGCVLSGTVAVCSLGYACTIPAGMGDVQCGAGSTCTGMCGDSCDVECTGGAMCDLEVGDSSSSNCDQSECTIVAGNSASYDCTNGATCDVTAGEGSSLLCDDVSTCAFTCTSTCSAQCLNESICTIQCPGDDAPRDFTGEVSCE